MSGAYALFSLGSDGSFLQWPSIYASDWEGAANVKKRRSMMNTPDVAKPVNVVSSVLDTVQQWGLQVTTILDGLGIASKITAFCLLENKMIVGTDGGMVYLLAVEEKVEDIIILFGHKTLTKCILWIEPCPQQSERLLVQSEDTVSVVAIEGNEIQQIGRISCSGVSCVHWSMDSMLYALSGHERIDVQ